jgi:branched-chain amino acid aminotransferase
MSQKLVMIDGELRSAEHASISVFDRGFLYGDSVFETLRTYGGKPFAVEEHLGRLQRSADLVAIELPVSRAVIREEIERAILAAGNRESYVRVMITRGTGELGLDPGLAHHPLRVIIVAPLEPPRPEAYARGIAAITFRTQRATDETEAVGAKVGNYLVAVLAMRAARAAGADEALIVDASGCIVEGATSNVFIVREGRVVTPPEDAGILPGITRAHLIRVCGEQGIPVDFRALPAAEVQAADEIFVSSSIRELLPVVRLDGQPIAGGIPGPLTQGLHREFRKKLKELSALEEGASPRPVPDRASG